MSKSTERPNIKTLKNPSKLEKSFEQDPMLDPNHSHLILVDDGSEGQFGKEIEFRNELEFELCKGKNLRYYKEKRKHEEKAKIQNMNRNVSYISADHLNDDELETIPEDSEQVPMVILKVKLCFQSLPIKN